MDEARLPYLIKEIFKINCLFSNNVLVLLFRTKSSTNFLTMFFILSEMARGSSLGRERVILVPGPNGITAMSQQHPGGHQEELNQELLAVSSKKFICFAQY